MRQENDDGEDGFPLVASWLMRPREAKHVSYSLRQQSGTYFFHSHFNMQQERGLVLPLIIPEISPFAGYGIAASVLQRAVDVLAVLEDRCPYWHDAEMPNECNNIDLQKRVMGFMSQDWDEIKGSIDDSFEGCDEAADGTDVFYVHHLINGMQHSRLRFPVRAFGFSSCSSSSPLPLPSSKSIRCPLLCILRSCVWTQES